MNERFKFRNVRQRALVCRTLLSRVGLEGLWSDEGPDPESLAYRGDGADELSRDAQLLLMTAWALWNRTETLSLVDLLSLEDEHLCAVAELLTAFSAGPDQIDAWLRRRANPRAQRSE